MNAGGQRVSEAATYAWVTGSSTVTRTASSAGTPHRAQTPGTSPGRTRTASGRPWASHSRGPSARLVVVVIADVPVPAAAVGVAHPVAGPVLGQGRHEPRV